METVKKILLEVNDIILLNGDVYTVRYGNYTENGINKIGTYANCEFAKISNTQVSFENLPDEVIKL